MSGYANLETNVNELFTINFTILFNYVVYMFVNMMHKHRKSLKESTLCEKMYRNL